MLSKDWPRPSWLPWEIASGKCQISNEVGYDSADVQTLDIYDQTCNLIRMSNVYALWMGI